MVDISENKPKVQSCRQLNDNVHGIHNHRFSYVKVEALIGKE